MSYELEIEDAENNHGQDPTPTVESVTNYLWERYNKASDPAVRVYYGEAYSWYATYVNPVEWELDYKVYHGILGMLGYLFTQSRDPFGVAHYDHPYTRQPMEETVSDMVAAMHNTNVRQMPTNAIEI